MSSSQVVELNIDIDIDIDIDFDICINNIDFGMVYSLIPRYTLCLLRSWRKETESFCDTFFFRQGMGLPYVFKVSVWTIVCYN